MRQAAGRPQALDANAAGRRDGQAYRSRQPVGRDRAPPVGRKRPQAVAQGHVVHSLCRRRIRRPHGGRFDLYVEAPDPERPLVCFDETPVQLIGEVRQPIPAQPGQRERYDHEYRRNGTVNLFVTFDPHRGWRNVKATDRRAAVDYAHCMRELVDVHYPDAACIRVVQMRRRMAIEPVIGHLKSENRMGRNYFWHRKGNAYLRLATISGG